MGFRETLADRPAVTNGITVGVIIAALAFIAVDVLRPRPTTATGQTIYFTTDDGLHYFPDAAAKLPPFDVDGKPAVRAYVYACEKSPPFVAYVERLTPDAAAKLTAAGPPPVDRDFVIAEGTEVKRPGETEWVKRASAAGEKILDLHCPAGDGGFPHLVLPGD